MGNDVTEVEVQTTLSNLTGSEKTKRIVFEEFVFLMVQLDMVFTRFHFAFADCYIFNHFKRQEIVENDEFALVFQHLDKDGDGFISADDLKQLLVGMGQNITEKHLTVNRVSEYQL